MIIFYGEGRLGNQILQYQALNALTKPSEIVLSVGLESLQQTFTLCGPRIVVLVTHLWLKRLIKYVALPLILRPVARALRLINYAFEPVGGTAPHIGATGQLAFKRGLFSKITFVDGGYYQNAQLWPHIFPANSITLNELISRSAQEHLQSCVPSGHTPFFVHVRRGDYLTYGSYGLRNFSLPVSFYRDAIQLLLERNSAAHLIFVTDDEKWVTATFSDILNKSIVSVNPEFDFAIMANCRGGVLSNSTFSLCAAFMLNKPDMVIAPQFWFGFRVNNWYPPLIRVAHPSIHYLAVSASAT